MSTCIESYIEQRWFDCGEKNFTQLFVSVDKKIDRFHSRQGMPTADFANFDLQPPLSVSVIAKHTMDANAPYSF